MAVWISGGKKVMMGFLEGLWQKFETAISVTEADRYEGIVREGMEVIRGVVKKFDFE